MNIASDVNQSAECATGKPTNKVPDNSRLAMQKCLKSMLARVRHVSANCVAEPILPCPEHLDTFTLRS